MSNVQHLNFSRLKNIRNNLAESVGDLKTIRDKLNSIEDKDVRLGLINSLRLSVVQLKEELSRYVSAVLKSSLIAVNEYSSFSDSIEKCTELGFLPEMNRSSIKLLVSYRNASCRRYKEPSATLLFDFIDNDICYIESLIFFIDDIIESKGPVKNKSIAISPSNKFN